MINRCINAGYIYDNCGGGVVSNIVKDKSLPITFTITNCINTGIVMGKNKNCIVEKW
jgi:hypothetical protein